MSNDNWTFISIKTRMLVDTFFMAIKVKFVGDIFRANLTSKFCKFGEKFFTDAYRSIDRCFYAYKIWNFLITKKRFSGKTLIFLKFSTLFFCLMSSFSIAEYESINNSIFTKKWYTCFIAITAEFTVDKSINMY
jgi:hypothetical protein